MTSTEKIFAGILAGLGAYLLLRGRASADRPIDVPGRAERNIIEAYHNTIWRSGAAFGIDPAIIAGVIYVESRGDPGAVGQSNERGLMQILPATAASSCGIADSGALFEPEVNVRCGAKYLRYCLDRFPGNVAAMLCAYNAGPNAVRVENGRISAPSSSRSYALNVMGRVPGFRVDFRSIGQYAAYYSALYRPSNWRLNTNDFGM